LSEKEGEYLKLYYLFKRVCMDNGISDFSLASLIENHAQNEKKCKILHSCARLDNITLKKLKEYNFKHCTSTDCPFK